MRAGLFALIVVWSTGSAAAPQHHIAGEFDYYLLALSWSPTYCASQATRDPLQCGPGRRYDFVVHGLWPQYHRGWPQYCAANEIALPEPVIAGMLDIMPSPRLVQHQWDKHGTCAGLAPSGYFALTRKLYDKVKFPARYIKPSRSFEVSVDQMIADFVSTNRGLARDMMSVQCGSRRDRARLSELRICFSRHGAFRPCSASMRRQCRAKRLVLPPVR